MKKRLTLKQWAFVAEFAKHGNKCRAYRAAYDCSRMSERTARRKAMEVAALPHVRRELNRIVREARWEARSGLDLLFIDAQRRIETLDFRGLERSLKIVDALYKRLDRFAPGAGPTVTFNMDLR